MTGPLPGWTERVDTFGFEERTESSLGMQPIEYAPGGMGGAEVDLAIAPPPQVSFTPGAPDETAQSAQAVIDEQARISRLKNNAAEDWESTKNLGARIGTKVFDAFGALPASVGEGLISAITRNPFAGSQDLLDGITGKISQEELGKRIQAREEEHKASIPELPRLTISELQAQGKALDARTTGGDPDTAYRKELARQDIQESVDREERPFSSFFGDTIGTGATLAIGRGALRGTKGSLASNQRAMKAKSGERAATVQAERQAAKEAGSVLPPLDKTSQFTAREQFLTSPFMQSLKSGASKSAEAGIEGAALAALEGGDPVAMAGWTAGTQAAGSGLLKLFENPFSRTTLGIVGGAILITGGFDQLVGEDARILDITEAKLGLWAKAALAGGGAALMGAGRTANLNSPLLRKYTGVADGVDALMRGNTAGMISQLADDRTSGQPVIKPTLDAIVRHPERFTENELNRIGRAFKSGKIKQEIELMLERDAFRQKVGL